MNEKLKKAYELIKNKSGFDKVEYCSQISNDEFIFGMQTLEEDDLIMQPINDDEGLYKVNVATGIVEPLYMIDLAEGEFPKGKEINPEYFEANKLFNL